MSISTTIKKEFFKMKLADLRESGYFIEFKDCKPFWDKRLAEYDSNRDDLDIEIVFLVGSKPHRFRAISIWKVHRDFVYAKYAEAIKTEFAYAIKCVPLEVKDISCLHVGDSAGCDDCKFGLEAMSCEEELKEFEMKA